MNDGRTLALVSAKPREPSSLVSPNGAQTARRLKASGIEADVFHANNVLAHVADLPGFVEGFVYEQQNGESRYNFLTTAVWESEEAFENAKRAVASENQKQGLNREDTAKKLGIEMVRSTYERSPY